MDYKKKLIGKSRLKIFYCKRRNACSSSHFVHSHSHFLRSVIYAAEEASLNILLPSSKLFVGKSFPTLLTDFEFFCLSFED
jgi:hypothetical protein